MWVRTLTEAAKRDDERLTPDYRGARILVWILGTLLGACGFIWCGVSAWESSIPFSVLSVGVGVLIIFILVLSIPREVEKWRSR